MAKKDVNIHIRVKEAGDAKRKVDKVKKSTEDLGKKTEQAGKKGAKGMGAMHGKLGAVGQMLGTAKGMVIGFVAAWMTMEGPKRLLDWFIQKLERIQQIQSDIYDKSVQLSRIGQDLEAQTQTTGKQEFWTKEALRMQEAGSLESTEAAKQIMISLDIAFGKQGGIQNKAIRELGRDIAPFIGAMGMGGAEVSKVFELANTAGIEATPEAYKQFFAQVTAAFTRSKATDPGAFATGLQKGGTEYLVAGGSLNELLARFASARMVTANERLAATLFEQVTRLSKGGREKARKAIERKMGVRWKDIDMDERLKTFLKYVETVPEAEREAVLVKHGFPEELAGRMGTVVSAEAKGVYREAMELIDEGTVEKMDAFTGAYKKSLLGKDLASKAKILLMEAEVWDRDAGWERLLREAEKRHEIAMELGQDDNAIIDKNEPAYIALGNVLYEIQSLELEGRQASDRDYWAGRINTQMETIRGLGPFYKKAYSLRTAKGLAGAGLRILDDAAEAAAVKAEEVSRLRKKKLDARAAMKLLFREGAPLDAIRAAKPGLKEAREAYNMAVYGHKWLDLSDREAEAEIEAGAESGPQSEPPPAGDLSEGQSRVIQYNEHYDYSINLNPVAGNAEDRLIGPPFDMYA